MERIGNIDSENLVYLLNRIEKYLRRSGIAPSRFGREALADPAFVRGLRDGREPRQATVRKVCAYLDQLGG